MDNFCNSVLRPSEPAICFVKKKSINLYIRDCSRIMIREPCGFILAMPEILPLQRCCQTSGF